MQPGGSCSNSPDGAAADQAWGRDCTPRGAPVMRAIRPEALFQSMSGPGERRHRSAGQESWPGAAGDLTAVRPRRGQCPGSSWVSRQRAHEPPEALLHGPCLALVWGAAEGGRLRDPALPSSYGRPYRGRGPQAPCQQRLAPPPLPGPRPPCCAPLAPGRPRGEAVVECEPRGGQGGASSVCEGTPHRRTVAPYDCGCRGTPSFAAPCAGAYPTDPFVPCFFGLAGGCLHGLRRLAESMAVTEWVGPIGAPRRDGTAAGPWAVRHEADKRSLEVVTHGPAPDGQGGRGRGQPTAGPQNCPGEAIPEAPEPLMADVRLEAIEGQDALALHGGDPRQAGGSRAREGQQGVVALEQRRDRPRGDGPPAVAQVRMDGGATAVVRGAQGATPRHDIEATLVLGEGPAALGFRTGGTAERRTGAVETASDWEGERPHVVQGRDRARVMTGRPHRLTAARARTPE
jgi:hypothetical protein